MSVADIQPKRRGMYEGSDEASRYDHMRGGASKGTAKS